MNKINAKIDQIKPYAPFILRMGMVFVFIWFGLNQLLNPSAWTGLIPAWILNVTGLSATTFVYLNGIFEVVCAILIAFNVWTRIIALLLFLHLLGIVADVGLTAIGVRDIGLAVATLVIALLQ